MNKKEDKNIIYTYDIRQGIKLWYVGSVLHYTTMSKQDYFDAVKK